MVTMGLPKAHMMKLNSQRTLRDVLYVHGLNCSLISIGNFINELFCIVIFTHKLSAIQDRSLRGGLEKGEQRSGVYFFKDV